MSTATLQIEKKKTLVPQLRFQEFEGEWKVKDFGSIVTKSKSKHDPQKNKEEFPCIEMESISKESSILLDIFNSKDQKSIKNKFKKGAVLFGKLRPNLKKYIQAPFDGVCSSEIWVLNGKELTNDFLFRLVQTNKFYSTTMVTSGSKMPRADWDFISSFPFSFPTLPEQQKIATFLSSVDDKTQQLTRKKELLEQYKKGLMQQLFSGKLRFKDENGEDYADWEEKKLGDVCKLNPKSSLLPSCFIYIDLESVIDGQLLKETKIQLSEAPSRAQRLLSNEDILFQMVRPYQKNNLFFNRNGVYVASTGYAQLRAKESSMFLYQLIHTTDFVNKVIDRCTGTSYPAINSTDLSNIEISIPSIQEQQKIASFLSSIDAKIESTNQQITQTQTFKKGLLQQMFV